MRNLHTNERLSPEAKAFLERQDVSFDVHCHLFTSAFFPENYLRVRTAWLFKPTFWKKLTNLLSGKRKDDDGWTQHVAGFMEAAGRENALELAVAMFAELEENTLICPLMMDLTTAFPDAGVPDVFTQLNYLSDVQKHFPERVLPFVALDPNNPRMEELFEMAFSEEHRFFGVKIYPLLGYLPSHPRLQPIFEICERYDIPVVTHCGGFATIVPANDLELPQRLYKPNGTSEDKILRVHFDSASEKGKFLGDPDQWRSVLENYPRLRLNLAHFGGVSEWKRYARLEQDTWVHRIVALMEDYQHVYTDVSYLMHQTESAGSGFERAFSELLREKRTVRERTLYGSDYYMILLEGKLRQIRENFLIRLSDREVKLLTQDNPRRFLNI